MESARESCPRRLLPPIEIPPFPSQLIPAVLSELSKPDSSLQVCFPIDVLTLFPTSVLLIPHMCGNARMFMFGGGLLSFGEELMWGEGFRKKCEW